MFELAAVNMVEEALNGPERTAFEALQRHLHFDLGCYRYQMCWWSRRSSQRSDETPICALLTIAAIQLFHRRHGTGEICHCMNSSRDLVRPCLLVEQQHVRVSRSIYTDISLRIGIRQLQLRQDISSKGDRCSSWLVVKYFI